MDLENRSKFSNKLGFVLAAAGSAVGLGNIWRFPYLAAKYGGGMFLLIYLILVVTFGFAIMITEIAIGRKTGLSPIGAFAQLGKKYSFIGVLSSLIAFLILPYYSVIGGWIIKYLVVFVSGGVQSAATDGFFESFIASPVQPILWQSLFVGATLIVILLGVKGGIERASKILMPVLVVLCVVVSVYVCVQPGAVEGLKYYLLPDVKHFSVNAVLGALGQMFYSMSLAMGIMITYGSYMRKEDDLEKSVGHIEIFDTGIAFLGGLMIVPAVFVFSNGDLGQAGPGLMFVTLPKVFQKMGLSSIVGSAFFLLVLFAALTSAISLMEAVTSTVCDQFHMKRKPAAILVAVLAILIGAPSSLGFGVWDSIQLLGFSILDFFDFITNSVLMPITALLTCLFVGFIIGPKTVADEVKLSSAFRREKMYNVVIKWIAPICIFAILVSSVLNAFGVIHL